MLNVEIQSYVVFLNPAAADPGGIHAGSHSLLLYDALNRFFARINFTANEDLTGVQAILSSDPPFFHMSFPLSDYEAVLDILRNEKPVYVRFDGTEQRPRVSLSTSNEPIGEGEFPF